jgi:nucleotide-binding universal stress UspA family protein
MSSIKILIPTDFSVQGEYAYLMAQNLSKHIDCEAHFVHTMSIPDTVSVDTDGRFTTCGEISVSYLQQQQQIALRQLQQLEQTYPGVKAHLAYGKTIDGTLDFAAKGSFDLIVVGTKGASGVKEMLSGSLTQVLVRRSPIPVLTVMCDRSELEVNDMLVVLDFDRPHNYALPLLSTLSSALGAAVHLLHIAQRHTQVDVARGYMDEFAMANGLAEYHTHFVQDSDVERGVFAFQESHAVDMIYMEHSIWHNRPDASERLVNHMYKPIMVVNPPVV